MNVIAVFNQLSLLDVATSSDDVRLGSRAKRCQMKVQPLQVFRIYARVIQLWNNLGLLKALYNTVPINEFICGVENLKYCILAYITV